MADNNTQPTAPPLSEAPSAEGPPPEAKPTAYRSEFLIETAEGFHVLVVGENLHPRDVLNWTKNTSIELHKQGFKPVRRDTNVTVTTVAGSPTPAAAAAPAGAGGAGEASAIAPTQIGEPPRCSLHGSMKHVTGIYGPTYKSGPKQGQPNPQAGEAFAFWACSNSRCKTTWRAAA